MLIGLVVLTQLFAGCFGEDSTPEHPAPPWDVGMAYIDDPVTH